MTLDGSVDAHRVLTRQVSLDQFAHVQQHDLQRCSLLVVSHQERIIGRAITTVLVSSRTHVPVEPLPVHADATQLEMELQTYERPLAATPFGAPELVPDWQDSHAMSAYVPPSCLGHWVRTDLGVRTFQGLGRNAPLRDQVVRRLTRDAHTHQILESLPCDIHLQVPLHRRCLPGCGPQTSATRDIQTTFVYRLRPSLPILCATTKELSPAPFPSGGGGVPCSFLRPFHLRLSHCCCGDPHFHNFLWMVPLRIAHLGCRP